MKQPQSPGVSKAVLKPFPAEGGALQLYAVSQVDATAEAQSNENNQVYFGRGHVQLQPGDVVFDIGANVGSFARTAAPSIGAKGTVYCVEPMEDVVEALVKNIGLYREWAKQQGKEVGAIVPVHAGVGDGSDGSFRVFTHYPKITAFSSMYPDPKDAVDAVHSLILMRPFNYTLSEKFGKWLSQYAPVLFRKITDYVFMNFHLKPALQVRCPMTTVSELIDKYNISEVGLVKVNVERAEMDVLNGIKPQHWTRIRQVHNINGRVQQMKQLLESKGYLVVVFKEARFQHCCLYMVYASR